MSPGDEVVCVADAPMCRHCLIEPSPEYPMPEVGRHYVVGMAASAHCSGCGVRAPGMRPAGHGLPMPLAWPQEWFRHLDYDEGTDERARERELEPA